MNQLQVAVRGLRSRILRPEPTRRSTAAPVKAPPIRQIKVEGPWDVRVRFGPVPKHRAVVHPALLSDAEVRLESGILKVVCTLPPNTPHRPTLEVVTPNLTCLTLSGTCFVQAHAQVPELRVRATNLARAIITGAVDTLRVRGKDASQLDLSALYSGTCKAHLSDATHAQLTAAAHAELHLEGSAECLLQGTPSVLSVTARERAAVMSTVH